MPTEQKMGGTEQRELPGRAIRIETLDELQDHSEAIFERLNADKRLALLVIADPVGVLRDLGYELSRDAARMLTRRLPRMPRLARDNYLRWLGGLERIPETIDLKFRRRSSGLELLQPRPKSHTLDQADPPGETAGFDVVLQFAQGFCERLIQRHYADGRLPRSAYLVTGKLHYFVHSGAFEQSKPSLGDPEQEIHFAKPALDFLPDKPTRVSIASPFQVSGFDVKPLKGVATIEGELIVAKDAKGHPLYIDVSFDNLLANDVQVQMAAPGVVATSEIKTLISTVYRDFRKLVPFLARPTPITFTLVDSDVLANQGVTPQPGEVKFAVLKPAGITDALLLVGFNRAERKGNGNLGAIACAIKPGGDFAVVQDPAWPQQGLNEGQSAILPKRFNPDTGQVDPNGALRIDSVEWHFRDGGLTAKVAGEHADALLWIDADVSGEAYIDITFHASDPEIVWEGHTDLGKYLDCLEKGLLVFTFMIAGALLGGVIGGIIGGAVGAAVGAALGAIAGEVGALYLIGWYVWKTDTSGISPPPSKTQTIKMTQTRSIPEIWGTVKVVPNDFHLTATAINMSAAVIGPVTEEFEPYITVAGSFSADFELPVSSQQPGPPLLLQTTPAAVQKLAAINQVTSAFHPAVVGSIKLFYSVVDTWGLQGTLSYLWTFNSNPIGTQSKIVVEVPITDDMLTNFQFNKVNQLGILRLAVEDCFGRRATWTGTISVGREQDLRVFRQALIKQPGFIDPIMPWRELERLPAVAGPPAQVGWEIGGQITPGGTLVSQLAFTAHDAAEPMILVCTTLL
jgi:hypothetical protein